MFAAWFWWPLVALVCLALAMSWNRWCAHRFAVRLIRRQAQRHGVEIDWFHVRVSPWWPFSTEIYFDVSITGATNLVRAEYMMRAIWTALDQEFGDSDDA